MVKRTEPYDQEIARPSLWGNPYSHKPSALPDTIRVATREEAIRKYIEWLDENPQMIDLMRKFLKGKRLSCFCDSDQEPGKIVCHGQVIVAILEGMDPRDVVW